MWTAPLLTLLLFVLSALFVRAAILSALAAPILAALLLAAGRLIILRIASGRLLAAAPLIFIASMLSLRSLLFISVVWHIYFSLLIRQDFELGRNRSTARL